MLEESDLEAPMRVKITSAKLAEDFYLRMLGMQEVEDRDDITQGHILLTRFQSPRSISLIQVKIAEKQSIEILTEDCVMEYHHLKKKGVVFKKVPGYTGNGLQAEFTDPFGNTFLLTEKRNYNLKIIL